MYIVLDSNIWLSELGLTTSKGAATRFYIKKKQAKLALPEVIKEEVERNLYNNLTSYSNKIKENHRQLLSVFGQLKDVVLPSENEIAAKADSLFEEVKIDLHHIPFTLESAKSSLKKINDKEPPSDKNQQFKDGVIWADCMVLLAEKDVFLVTEDKAFFQEKKYGNGLAKNLEEEAKIFNNNFKIYSSLTNLLEEIKINITINKDELVSEYTKTIQEPVNSMLERTGFSISSGGTADISSFITEDPNKLYIEFNINFDCIDERNEGRTDGKLLAKGDGYYDPDKEKFLELKNRGEELCFNKANEERKNIRNIYGEFGGVIGHRSVEHTIRYPIK